MFHLVCRFNRAGRSNLSPPESVVREQIALTLEECETRFTDGRNGLDEQKLDRFRRPLYFFADFIIRNSALTCAFDWHARPLAHARYGEMAGDDVFFEEHQREMQTDDALATELLRLYHECMALGFSGAYQYEPQRVGDLMAATRAELARRGISSFEDPHGHVSPQAYAHTDVTVLPTGDRNRIIGVIVTIAIGVTLVLIALSFYVWDSRAGQIVSDLDWLTTWKNDTSAQETAP